MLEDTNLTEENVPEDHSEQIVLKHNGKYIPVDSRTLIILAQKGLDYDRIRKDRDQSREKLEQLEDLAAQYHLSVDALLDILANGVQRMESFLEQDEYDLQAPVDEVDQDDEEGFPEYDDTSEVPDEMEQPVENVEESEETTYGMEEMGQENEENLEEYNGEYGDDRTQYAGYDHEIDPEDTITISEDDYADMVDQYAQGFRALFEKYPETKQFEDMDSLPQGFIQEIEAGASPIDAWQSYLLGVQNLRLMQLEQEMHNRRLAAPRAKSYQHRGDDGFVKALFGK